MYAAFLCSCAIWRVEGAGIGGTEMDDEEGERGHELWDGAKVILSSTTSDVRSEVQPPSTWDRSTAVPVGFSASALEKVIFEEVQPEHWKL